MYGCRLRVEPDGANRNLNTGLVMASPVLHMTILGLCFGEPFNLIGRNDPVRRISNRAVSRFLRAILMGKKPFGVADLSVQ